MTWWHHCSSGRFLYRCFVVLSILASIFLGYKVADTAPQSHHLQCYPEAGSWGGSQGVASAWHTSVQIKVGNPCQKPFNTFQIKLWSAEHSITHCLWTDENAVSGALPWWLTQILRFSKIPRWFPYQPSLKSPGLVHNSCILARTWWQGSLVEGRWSNHLLALSVETAKSEWIRECCWAVSSQGQLWYFSRDRVVQDAMLGAVLPTVAQAACEGQAGKHWPSQRCD